MDYTSLYSKKKHLSSNSNASLLIVRTLEVPEGYSEDTTPPNLLDTASSLTMPSLRSNASI